MFITYIVVTILAAAANIFSATLDFIRYEPILINMAKVGVSESWITTLGILKAAGALGLLIGIGVPAVGIAAATASSCFLSALSSLTCADTTTRLAWRSCSFSWQSPRWACDWLRVEESPTQSAAV
jgi:DoxX-like family